MKNIINIFLITFLINKLNINCQDCSSARASSYKECSIYNNETAGTICCYVKGSNSGNCLEVDAIFENKTLNYNSKKLSGALICSTTYSKSNYLNVKTNIKFFILIFIIIFL